MTFALGETGEMPDLTPIAGPTPGGLEAFQAGALVERIETDSWQNADRRARDYFEELREGLGAAYGEGPKRGRRRQLRLQDEVKYITQRAATLKQNDADGRYDHIPENVDAFNSEVTKRLKAEHEEASEVLELSHGPYGFLGRMWTGATDETTVLTLPFGASGAARIGTAVAIEAMAGAGGEALTLPRQYQMAERLDLPEPNPWVQLGAAGILGGAFGGATAGAARYLEYRKALKETDDARKPEGSRPFTFSDSVRAAESDLRSGGQGKDKDARQAVAQSARDAKDVPISYGITATTIRNKPAQQSVEQSLREAVAPLGDNIGFVITSGGQDPRGLPGARRTGSTRHDHGGAVDGYLTRDGKRVNPSEDKELYARFFFEAAQRFQGIGHYSWGVHVGGGSVAAWGPTKSGRSLDPYFGDAIKAGRAKQGNWTPQAAAQSFTPTSRGYTGDGKVTVGNDFTVDVEYVVVDASSLTRASGDLQPRDRSRAASDEQVATIAAQLDPARLMPGPEADRGAPVVGPDSIIESGNGRVMAIERAYEKHPDRANAYREQIEAAGYEIPEGVESPVLIARRKSDLTPEQRREFVTLANAPTVARMSASERASVDASLMSRETVALFDTSQPLASSGNRAFVRRFLDALPGTERAALVDSKGALNAEGIQRIRQAMFARAFDAADILARFTETGAGDLKTLMDALEQVSPDWAALRSAINGGEIRPEMDITAYVLEAMRIVATAREIAAREGKSFAGMLNELIEDVDLLEGATSPLTAALVHKLIPNGRAARADKIAEFLKRYANEAEKIGGTEAALFELPGPLDALKAIDPDGFADVKAIGVARIIEPPKEVPQVEIPESAFKEGVESPEAEAAAIAIEDDMRKILEEFGGDLDFEIPLDENTSITLSEVFDELDADDALDVAVSACAVRGGQNG